MYIYLYIYIFVPVPTAWLFTHKHIIHRLARRLAPPGTPAPAQFLGVGRLVLLWTHGEGGESGRNGLGQPTG